MFEHQPSVRTRRLAAIRCPRINSCGESVPANNSTLSSKPIKNFRLCVLQGDSALYVIAELVEFYLTVRQCGIASFTDKMYPIKRPCRTHQCSHYELDIFISRCFDRVWWRIRYWGSKKKRKIIFGQRSLSPTVHWPHRIFLWGQGGVEPVKA